MPGTKFTIDTVFTDQSLPVLLEDPTLPPSEQGVLGWWEVGHPIQVAPAGMPAHNAVFLQNLAVDQANAMLGQSANSGNLYYAKGDNQANWGDFMFAERTTKGGLHLSPKRAQGAEPVNMATRLTPSNSWRLLVDTYVKANPTHDWFISTWGRVTRPVSTSYTPGAPAVMLWDNGSYSIARFFHRSGGGDTNYPVDAQRLGWHAVGTSNQATGPVYQDIGVSPSNPSLTSADIIRIGASRWEPSMILYRAYIENLTISGRTYQQAHDANLAEFNKQVVNPGGRYYGDTFTAPT